MPRKSPLLFAAALAIASCSSVPNAAVPSTEASSNPNPTVSVAPEFANPIDVVANEDWFATGFLRYPIARTESAAFDAGYSMYITTWPFQQTYPGPSYQSGLPGTWLYPEHRTETERELYSTIEGGLGWWNDTRFATETPKFIMGGVAYDFTEWANGPGAGAGNADVDRRDWVVAQGKYGVAQLSPNVLWAPDGLNLEEGTNGELFGYGYHPLPIIDTQENTAGTDITTGNQSWTLFLRTGNFQGPVSFFVPNFFSKPALDDPTLEGQFFDTSPSATARDVEMETQVIPAAYGTDLNGVPYARVNQMQFPANTPGGTIVVNSVSSYAKTALWDATMSWFDGGSAPTGQFEVSGTLLSEFEKVEASELSSYTLIFEGMNESQEYPIDWELLADTNLDQPNTFGYQWNLDLVTLEDDSYMLPEYYRLEQDTTRGFVWRPVLDSDVPTVTGLQDHVFPDLGVRQDSEPYETPTDPESIWQSPGPAAGPFQAELGDGSIITYSWYRFIDQPAIVHWDFSDDERSQMQSRVEAIHRAWGPEQEYLAPPSVGEVANLDPQILVTPPAGFEVGYVPIVTRQELAR